MREQTRTNMMPGDTLPAAISEEAGSEYDDEDETGQFNGPLGGHEQTSLLGISPAKRSGRMKAAPMVIIERQPASGTPSIEDPEDENTLLNYSNTLLSIKQPFQNEIGLSPKEIAQKSIAQRNLALGHQDGGIFPAL